MYIKCAHTFKGFFLPLLCSYLRVAFYIKPEEKKLRYERDPKREKPPDKTNGETVFVLRLGGGSN